MPAKMHGSLIALFFLVMVADCSGSALGQEGLDTSRLPRPADSRAVYAAASTTNFVTGDPVPQTAEAVASTLRTAGWQRHLPASREAELPTLRSMTFTKGSLALSVFITPAPTQASATSVHYTALALRLAHDLPSPKHVSDEPSTAEAPRTQPAGFTEATGRAATPNARAERVKSIDELAEQILSQILSPSAAALRGRPGADERTSGLMPATATY
jgi:hypothetical protein